MTKQSTKSASTLSMELQWAVQNFLYEEALLLGERRHSEWLNLLAEDLTYFMPVRQNTASSTPEAEFSKPGQLAHFDETKASLSMRVKRLATGRAWAEEPPSRICHMVSNVLVGPGDLDCECKVTSCFLIYRTRLERDLEIFAGKRRDVVRRSGRTGSGWELKSRYIMLDQSTVLAKNISFFI